MNKDQIKQMVQKIKSSDISQEDFIFVLENLSIIFSVAKSDGPETQNAIKNLISKKALFIGDFNDIMDCGIDELKSIALDRFEVDGVPNIMKSINGKLEFTSSAGPVAKFPLNKGAALVLNKPELSVHPKLYYRVSDHPLELAFDSIGREKIYGQWMNDGFTLDKDIFGVSRVKPNGCEVFNQSVRNTGNKMRGKIVLVEDFDGSIRMDAAVLALTDIIKLKTTDSMSKMAKGLTAAGLAATVTAGIPQKANAMDVKQVKSIAQVQEVTAGGPLDYLVDSATSEIEFNLNELSLKISDLLAEGAITENQANNLQSRVRQINEKISAINSPNAKESYKKIQSQFTMMNTWAEDFVKDPLKAVKGSIKESDFRELEFKMKNIGDTASDVAGTMKSRATNVVIF